ncbi:DNA-binding protein [Salipaludibacillus daqingensis]|uniref:DNA-binding protein n=1 Tax=Salipaludibacillus daqingensis TaxID=3041001 RepID=UPI0024762367|nr:DNA-binding protein [Salipaludibacillus daqingensis]
MEWIAIAIGIAVAGFFIGEGIKNVGKGSDQASLASFKSLFENQDQFIKEKHLHDFLGISKEDAQSIAQKYPDIPHVTINGNIYYPKAKLRQWLNNL